MKHWVPAVLAVAALVGCGGSGGSSNGQATDKSPVVVGLVILSGPAGANHDHMMQGFNLALDEINKNGILGGRKLQLDSCEDQLDPNQSTACARRLTSQDNRNVVILDTGSGLAQVDQEITGKAKAVSLLPSQRDTALTENGNQYLFRTGISGQVEAQQVEPQIVKAIQPKTVGMLARGDSFGKDEIQQFSTLFQKDGVKVTYSATFEPKQTDFAAELTKVKAADPDVLLMIGETNQGATISQQAKQLGVRAKLVASSGMTSPDLIRLSKGAMDGQYAFTTLPHLKTPAADAFFTAFKAKYGEEPSGIAVEAYTALKTLAKALGTAGTADDAEKVRAALAKTTFDSPIGTVKFDAKGQNQNAVDELEKVQGDQFVRAVAD